MCVYDAYVPLLSFTLTRLVTKVYARRVVHTTPGDTNILTMAMHLLHTAMYLHSNNDNKNHKNVGASFVIYTRAHTVRIGIQTMPMTTTTTSLDYILILGVQHTHTHTHRQHPTAAIKLKRKTLHTNKSLVPTTFT